ncbi:hypothetical protein B0T10DRAFT_527436 [Thelonectria olida]|uniref:Monocarboxylate transporter 4 n=1 Tax=Thelonectria olida TaxID=1576542 RepID=A0A9P8WBZ4_9HYPO|nr:hypothetical protein B0T10DRAFT_527436 [Thelonectria olida]
MFSTQDSSQGNSTTGASTPLSIESPFAFPTAPTITSNGAPPPKIGSRFSRDAVRVLRAWLTNHSQHPFASEEEKELLHRQTGLSKTQISNWLANARRRSKIQNVTASSRSQLPPADAVDIPRRPGTPAFEMNPLQRWVDSPPEYEPASATAIVHAIDACSETSPGTRSPYNLQNSNDGSGTPHSRASSASSRATSKSSGGSVYSYDSRDLTGPLKAFGGSHQRRKKRAAQKQKQIHTKTSLLTPLNTFQCTFCTETFRTKHNWQRHEKSLHLALEQWVCCPSGPRELDSNRISHCVFCGEVEPDDAHLSTHNYADCRGRKPNERIFNRKDHLGQHLRLVHNVKTKDLETPLSQWKTAAPDIRSRCGFCGIAMDTWASRVDHLADHFKSGDTMASWKGDWGFDDDVLARLENSIPPYFIAAERSTPFPFEARHPLSESPRTAYELIELELMHFVQVYYEQSRRLPTSDEMQLEGCRIICASEVLSQQDDPDPSWLRDLIMSSNHLVRQARLSPMRTSAESRLQLLKIMGQDSLFESCPLESQLRAFAGADQSVPLADQELQQEASRIIRRIEDQSTCPAEFIANWLIELAGSSTGWLHSFRKRAQIPYGETGMEPQQWPRDSSKIDSIMKNYSELERRLSEYVDLLQVHGVVPDDVSLQRQTQTIINGFEDEEWKQVAISNESWLMSFKRSNSTSQRPQNPSAISNNLEMVPTMVKTGPFNPHNTNFHRWMAVELARWVVATMSPNNPKQHIPTDEELQHQARWILYDDDDPWNSTPADTTEWLRQFKMDIGILKEPNVEPSLN